MVLSTLSLALKVDQARLMPSQMLDCRVAAKWSASYLTSSTHFSLPSKAAPADEIVSDQSLMACCHTLEKISAAIAALHM
jgi:hypothetical protein